ncbi:two-component system regulatory protein YycI [Kroppenstedtia eburnea]|uniref:two-component system regulatory protein YycI n=1 Tax=Kroppenstedtia eburnea TaxID=714067 RepID=UPI0036391E7C
MDWSRAKSILILAFFSLNVFLAYQLLEAKGEQSQTQQVSQDTRRELTELTSDKHIDIRDQLPENTPDVSYLQAEPLKMESLRKQDPRWRKNSSGGYTLTFRSPLQKTGDLQKILDRYVPGLQQYKSVDKTDGDSPILFQMWNGRPIFDDRLTVTLKGESITRLELTPFQVRSDNATATRPGWSAQSALVTLIKSGQIREGAVITDVILGYHGQSYDGDKQLLSPVWRIRTEDTTFYVNAITGASEIDTNGQIHEQQTERGRFN